MRAGRIDPWIVLTSKEGIKQIRQLTGLFPLQFVSRMKRKLFGFRGSLTKDETVGTSFVA